MKFDAINFFVLSCLFSILRTVLSFHHERACKRYSAKMLSNDYVMPLLPQRHLLKVKKPCEEPNSLIVGGQNASFGEFPHMAAVGSRQDKKIDWICGGSLIHEKYILTAAHCVKSPGNRRIDVVRLGAVNIDSGRHVDFQVEKAIVHPNYKPPVVYNDIALLKLKTKVTFNENVRPACLSAMNDLTTQPRPIVEATGWGHTSFGGMMSSYLLKVPLKIMSREECETHFQHKKQLPKGITDSLFCAIGLIQPYHDTCQGDSGGPLQKSVKGDACTKEIVGITSFGRYCGSGTPAMYVKVAHYIPWIEAEINAAN